MIIVVVITTGVVMSYHISPPLPQKKPFSGYLGKFLYILPRVLKLVSSSGHSAVGYWLLLLTKCCCWLVWLPWFLAYLTCLTYLTYVLVHFGLFDLCACTLWLIWLVMCLRTLAYLTYDVLAHFGLFDLWCACALWLIWLVAYDHTSSSQAVLPSLFR